MQDAADLCRRALASGNADAIRLAARLAGHPLTQFQPRPDSPGDQQHSFVTDRFAGLAVVLGGNGSGKTLASAAKVASLLLNHEPPERNTPYLIVSQTMDMAAGVCWQQGLARFIPDEAVADVVWHSRARGLPKSVVLKPHRNGGNWVVDIRSADMSRERLQGLNALGFWIDEQVEHEIIAELWARCRRWPTPGSKIYSLTPLSPDPRLEDLYREPPESWRFYRFDTRANNAIDPSFVAQIKENELDALVETRLSGAFARYQGMVYPSFDADAHVVKPFDVPKAWTHYRGIDLGWSHATACLWAARDLEGRYWVYKEYLQAKTSIEDHVAAINAGWSDVPVKGGTYADPAAAQTLYEFTLRGLPTTPANKDVKAGIGCVQGMLRPGSDGRPKLLIFDTCPNLVREMRTYVWDSKALDKPVKQDDDLVDCLRYLLYSSRSMGMDFKPLKLPEREKRVPW